MKILYVTTIGDTMCFFCSFIHELIDEGNTVDIACGSPKQVHPCYLEWGCNIYALSCTRVPTDWRNIKAIKEIHNILKNNKYDIVHCHTPIIAACTRLACNQYRKKGLKVFYTAHGFHFYSGAPFRNWILYYPIEWICSYITDILITINTEDYERAKRKLHAKKTFYVPGVGIDTKKFGQSYDGKKIKKEFNIASDAFILLSVGELNRNKNHQIVIKALEGLSKVIYVIVGSGEQEELRTLAKRAGVNLILAGYRPDTPDFYNAANAYILPSIREGLNVSLMEAMASGLPCLVGRIRGNMDLIDEDGGYMFDPTNVEEVREAIEKIMKDSLGMGIHNREKINKFDVSNVIGDLFEIYRGVFYNPTED